MRRTEHVWLIGAVLLIIALLFPLITKAAADGVLRRNATVGLRLPSTRNSDEAWRSAHRAALPWAYGVSAACVAGGVVVLTGMVDQAQLATLIWTWLGVVILLAVAGAWVGHRAAVDSSRRSQADPSGPA